jgi:putative ABC transport system ATP-binding protein
VYLDGKDITQLPDYKRSKQIGRLFQDPLKGTAPNMTIEENLALAYLRANHTKSPFSMVSKSDRAEFRERLAMLNLGLEARMDQPVGLLSGGQRQALTLLMATLVTPKILLLDEHTAALDPGTAEVVLELTKKIVAENNITCLMITHNLASSLAIGNRTIMMADGRIVLDIGGEERKGLTVDDLLVRFRTQGLDNDRIMLS